MPISAPGSKRQRGFTPVRRFAEHGFTPVRRFAEHGFTLVELMVVIAVIGVAAAAVVLMMPDPRGRVLDEGARFAARVRAAHDAAIVDGRPTSVWVTPTGYGFDQWRAGRWWPIAEKPLTVARWEGGTRATGMVRERVTFDATGLADRPLDLTLSREGRRASVAIGADGSVRVLG